MGDALPFGTALFEKAEKVFSVKARISSHTGIQPSDFGLKRRREKCSTAANSFTGRLCRRNHSRQVPTLLDGA
jgi:hypothetical protein